MKRTFIAWVILILTATLVHFSCTKIDITEVGAELIPAVDTVNTVDTVLDVITDLKLSPDTALSIYGEPHALGVIDNDAEFGKTTASIFASFTPASYKAYPFINRESVIVDSVIVSLGYSSAYGDSNSIQQVEVREIDPSADFTYKAYPFSSPDFAVESKLLGSKLVDFRSLQDSTPYADDGDTSNLRELRIPIDTSFARRFIGYDTLNAYSGDSIFKTFFKGLQITVNENESTKKMGLAYFDLTDAERTKITFYCRIQNNGVTDTIAPRFTYVTTNPQANLVKRTPSNNYLANINDGAVNEEKLYVQSTPGSYIDVKIPGLDSFPNVVIHRAELIFDKVPSSEEFYKPPLALFVEAVKQSAAGDSSFTLRNAYVESNSYPYYDINTLGGNYRNSNYTFNIARYVQTIVTGGYPNYLLRVQAPYMHNIYYTNPGTDNVGTSSVTLKNKVAVLLNVPVAAGRVVLFGGAAASPKKARLRIIYSRI